MNERNEFWDRWFADRAAMNAAIEAMVRDIVSEGYRELGYENW